MYEKALAPLRKVTTADPPNLKQQARLGTVLLHKGQAELSAGLASAAAGSLDEAGSIARTLREKDPAIRDHQLLFARVRFQQGVTGHSGSKPANCEPLREVAAVWANLAKGGVLAPAEAAEQRSVTAAAEACAANHTTLVAER